MENEPSPSIPSVTPMFQRLVTDEVQELKTYTRIIEEQNRRVTELERRTTDLEKRLAKANRDKADLERTLEFRETEWRNKFDRLESDRDHQKELVAQEKGMNSKLNYQVVQMEQEIHKFLTRKVRAIRVVFKSCHHGFY
jgi:septal ring factor EnvC (AmiA/AmiB activator)